MSEATSATFCAAAWTQIKRAANEMGRSHLRGALEAIIFAAPKPLSMRELSRTTKASKQDLLPILLELSEDYESRGLNLVEAAGGWTFMSSPAFGAEVRLVTGKKPVRMSRAQLETLSIVAYRQPVTRPEIDEVRGVDSGPVLRTLLDRELVKILGKKEEPGRPLLYGTTETFLSLTKLKSLSELPTLREFTELSDESRETYERKLGENAPTGEITFDDDPDEPIDPTQPRDDDEPEPEDEEDDEDDEDEDDDDDAVEGDDDEDLDDDFDDLDDEDDEDEDEDEDLDDEDDDAPPVQRYAADEEDVDYGDEDDEDDDDEDEEDDADEDADEGIDYGEDDGDLDEDEDDDDDDEDDDEEDAAADDDDDDDDDD